MAAIFLSHLSKDNPAAKALADWLKGAGFDDLFVDFKEISAGEIWRDALRRAKAACRVVICLVTPNWLDSDQCDGEFMAAWDRGKCPSAVRPIPTLDSVGSAEARQALKSIPIPRQGGAAV